MSLAVAGLSDAEIHTLTQRLAGDWSDFAPAERAAFAFARKQARDPAAVTDADLDVLEGHFGRDGAGAVAWWASRCHYMTRVADGFRLPLERDNPFWKMPGAVRKP